MDRHAITIATDWAALRRFAEMLRDQFGAELVLLFGSRARGDERRESDYDFIIVSPRFGQVQARRSWSRIVSRLE